MQRMFHAREDTRGTWHESYGCCYNDLKRIEQMWIRANNRAQDHLEQVLDAAYKMARLREQLDVAHAEAIAANR